MRIHIHIPLHITVYYAYIALYIIYTYHSSRTTIPCTSAYKRADEPLYTPRPLTSAGAQTAICQIMPGKAQKKCGYRAILYALYMVYIPLPTTKKHRKKSLS